MKRGYGHCWKLAHLHLWATPGPGPAPVTLYVDWRPHEPGPRWRIVISRHIWRPLHATPTRHRRILGFDIDWYAPGNDT